MLDVRRNVNLAITLDVSPLRLLTTSSWQHDQILTVGKAVTNLSGSSELSKATAARISSLRTWRARVTILRPTHARLTKLIYPGSTTTNACKRQGHGQSHARQVSQEGSGKFG